MSFKKVETTLSAAVADNGTFTVSYPSNTDAGSYTGGYAHKMWVAGLQYMASSPADFTLSFGTSNITVTWKGSTTIPAGSRVNIQLDQVGPDDNALHTNVDNRYRTSPMTAMVLRLGAPDAIDADGVSASAAITAAAGATIGGALASGGVATFDVPRNVIITSAADDSAKTFTVTGTDEYGDVVVEDIAGANAGAASGKKAFKTITAVDVDADTAGAVTIGNGDVLGLPIALPQKGLLIKEMEDGAAPTAGTILAADRSAATATTGDVRGTYDPNSACNGSKSFELVVVVADPQDIGVDQFAG